MKKGFALIYVLIFTTLVVITMTAIASAMVSEIKLVTSSFDSIQARILARNALDFAYSKSNSGALAASSPINCNDASQKFNRYYNNQVSEVDYKTPVPVEALRSGVFDYKICQNRLIGIGYYNNKKIIMIDRICNGEPTCGIRREVNTELYNGN